MMKYRSRALKISSDKEHNGFGGSEAQGKPELLGLLTGGTEGMGAGQDEVGMMPVMDPVVTL